MSDKKLIKCEINNQEIEVSEGTSIIEAFKKLDQPIAHYCWHPGLSVAGVCRLCMVDIKGIPKLQIACNIEVKEGMKISNQSEKVKSAVKWGLEFHLINHPLDCPICDQAGECELQEQYMNFGKYSPNMAERKVKKRKVVDLGPKIVLDSERCILCSRCVRFTDEVSKTCELGIFNRGDNSEIGVFKDKPLDNEYSVNTVDICPVGALTSKDFRFRQRVWYLKTADSVCVGCSTGCNIEVDYNEEGLFRVRPRYNKEINGHWMCDRGREVYRLPNKEDRLLEAQVPSSYSHSGEGRNPVKNADHSWIPDQVRKDDKAVEVLQKIRKSFLTDKEKNYNSNNILILTAQYTNEEYEDFISFFINNVGTNKDIYHWKNNPESFDNFDGLLLRGDKNPNTAGLLNILKEKNAINSWENLEDRLKKQSLARKTAMPSLESAESSADSVTIWVVGPEHQKVYPDLKEKISFLESYCDNVIWWTAHPLPVSALKKTWQIPTKTFFEKEGTFINAMGISQKVKAIESFVPSALTLSESVTILKGEKLQKPEPEFLKPAMKTNYFTGRKRTL